MSVSLVLSIQSGGRVSLASCNTLHACKERRHSTADTENGMNAFNHYLASVTDDRGSQAGGIGFVSLFKNC